MRAILSLLLLATPAVACDWTLTDRVDPMTDERVCIIRSEAAKLSLAVRGDVVTFLPLSAFSDAQLMVRVDDREAILISERSMSTNTYADDARRALAEIQSGQRLRVSFRDYPNDQAGDAPICTLPSLIESCR